MWPDKPFPEKVCQPLIQYMPNWNTRENIKKRENIFKGDGWEFYKTDEKYGSKQPRGIT